MIGRIMKRLDDDKVSLVEFLRSIKFAQQNSSGRHAECPTHFAYLHPRAHTGQQLNTEDSAVIRSAN